MNLTAKLTIGTVIRYDGQQWTVKGFEGGNLQLRSAKGTLALIEIGTVVSAEDFQISTPRSEDVAEDLVSFPDNIPEAFLKKAEVLLAHLNEVECGYKSGIKTAALEHEPRFEYDPDGTTLNQRLEAKAKELGVSTRTLWVLKTAYLKQGIYGLVDKRKLKVGRQKIDQRIVDAVRHVLLEHRDKSTITRSRVIELAKYRVKEQYPNEKIVIPSNQSFYRLLKATTKGTHAFGSAKGRRNAANRPKQTYRRQEASRPGEFLLIDTTPLDAFALDPLTFKWVAIQLTIALDLFTRSLVGWRITPVSTKAVDAALLLYDIIRPKLMQIGWPEKARWNYIGVPESIIVKLADDDVQNGIAGIPILHPETIVIDHGKAFISQAFKDACTRLGINLQLARVYTPTDKAQVERVFKTIREDFVQRLPGYKGPDVFARGVNVEEDAYYFSDEIDAKFACWVAGYYQSRPHEGLTIPGLPMMEVSPNDMYSEGIARAGFVHVVASELMYYELLPTEWRTVQHYGVELNGLRYNGDILNDYTNKKSPYTGVHNGKWPIRYDPRDLSRVFFYDTFSARWHELAWTHDSGEHRPFNEATLGFAKALLIARGGDSRDFDELAQSLNELLHRMLTPSDKDRRERRLAAVNAMNAQQVRKDQPATKASLPEPDVEENLFESGPITGPRTTVSEDSDPATADSNVIPLRSIEEAMEDDDDDLGY